MLIDATSITPRVDLHFEDGEDGKGLISGTAATPDPTEFMQPIGAYIADLLRPNTAINWTLTLEFERVHSNWFPKLNEKILLPMYMAFIPEDKNANKKANIRVTWCYREEQRSIKKAMEEAVKLFPDMVISKKIEGSS